MIFESNKYKNSQGWGFRVYRNEYPISAPTREFEALLIKLGKRCLWIFRNWQVYYNWPASN